MCWQMDARQRRGGGIEDGLDADVFGAKRRCEGFAAITEIVDKCRELRAS
jgi:hypothetical protein